MDTRLEVELIESLLAELEAMQLDSDGSAHEVIAQTVVLVNHINRTMSRFDTQMATGRSLRSDDILKKLKEWLDQLIGKLTEIVKDLADGTSFSISVGTSVSVTVNFSSSDKSSGK